mmetsp:Transcript_4762/g.8609  ORF Transcript_4762/g.8609 Transcript_4762/m.8609 type:complete len:201 (+) Transcript_4762:1620-2222(+)
MPQLTGHEEVAEYRPLGGHRRHRQVEPEGVQDAPCLELRQVLHVHARVQSPVGCREQRIAWHKEEGAVQDLVSPAPDVERLRIDWAFATLGSIGHQTLQIGSALLQGGLVQLLPGRRQAGWQPVRNIETSVPCIHIPVPLAIEQFTDGGHLLRHIDKVWGQGPSRRVCPAAQRDLRNLHLESVVAVMVKDSLPGSVHVDN